MSLRDQARADVAAFTQDLDGFGVAVTVTNPSGDSREMTGFAGDVAIEQIDVDTGQVFTARRASVSLTIEQFEDFGAPRARADKNTPPWVVEFNDSEGVARSYIVLECKPDRTVGLYTMTLEDYRRI